jgi:hypothetical protein
VRKACRTRSKPCSCPQSSPSAAGWVECQDSRDRRWPSGHRLSHLPAPPPYARSPARPLSTRCLLAHQLPRSPRAGVCVTFLFSSSPHATCGFGHAWRSSLRTVSEFRPNPLTRPAPACYPVPHKGNEGDMLQRPVSSREPAMAPTRALAARPAGTPLHRHPRAGPRTPGARTSVRARFSRGPRARPLQRMRLTAARQ